MAQNSKSVKLRGYYLANKYIKLKYVNYYNRNSTDLQGSWPTVVETHSKQTCRAWPGEPCLPLRGRPRKRTEAMCRRATNPLDQPACNRQNQTHTRTLRDTRDTTRARFWGLIRDCWMQDQERQYLRWHLGRRLFQRQRDCPSAIGASPGAQLCAGARRLLNQRKWMIKRGFNATCVVPIALLLIETTELQTYLIKRGFSATCVVPVALLAPFWSSRQ